MISGWLGRSKEKWSTGVDVEERQMVKEYTGVEEYGWTTNAEGELNVKI